MNSLNVLNRKRLLKVKELRSDSLNSKWNKERNTEMEMRVDQSTKIKSSYGNEQVRGLATIHCSFQTALRYKLRCKIAKSRFRI